jgi:hypothetical protein
MGWMDWPIGYERLAADGSDYVMSRSLDGMRYCGRAGAGLFKRLEMAAKRGARRKPDFN